MNVSNLMFFLFLRLFRSKTIKNHINYIFSESARQTLQNYIKFDILPVLVKFYVFLDNELVKWSKFFFKQACQIWYSFVEFVELIPKMYNLCGV
jgi:hypothetical protein